MFQRGLRLLKDVFMTKKRVQNPLLVVIGATGTGKSQLAVDLATRFNGEIINGDAMQMYNGLPIITNKPTVEEQQGIPHHLLGIVDLSQPPWCMADFKRKATKTIEEIRSRGKLPVLVGGTHYYTQSLLLKEGLTSEEGDEKPVGEFSRAEIGRKHPILEASTEEMLDQLRIVDPAIASRWHPKDRRRIQRSLEIYLMTGKQASQVYAEQKATVTPSNTQPLASTLMFWVHAENETLRARLDGRVDKMITAGLIDEVKELGKILQDQSASGNTVDRSSGICVSIGFKEFEPYMIALKNGTTSDADIGAVLASSIERTKAATRQYAKRQIQWIRLRLLMALSEAKALDHLYLLDGSNPGRWQESVSNPAIDTVQKFLAGEELPAPNELSPLAVDLLTPKYEEPFQNRRGSWTTQPCELCGLTFITEDTWRKHLRTRRHRKRVVGQAKMEEYNRWKARHEPTQSDTEPT